MLRALWAKSTSDTQDASRAPSRLSLRERPPTPWSSSWAFLCSPCAGGSPDACTEAVRGRSGRPRSGQRRRPWLMVPPVKGCAAASTACGHHRWLCRFPSAVTAVASAHMLSLVLRGACCTCATCWSSCQECAAAGLYGLPAAMRFECAASAIGGRLSQPQSESHRASVSLEATQSRPALWRSRGAASCVKLSAQVMQCTKVGVTHICEGMPVYSLDPRSPAMAF